jgi:hypothetical protein
MLARRRQVQPHVRPPHDGALPRSSVCSRATLTLDRRRIAACGTKQLHESRFASLQRAAWRAPRERGVERVGPTREARWPQTAPIGPGEQPPCVVYLASTAMIA